jgi:hypothetical protein
LTRLENAFAGPRKTVLYFCSKKAGTEQMKQRPLMKLANKEPVKLEPLGRFAKLPKELRNEGLAFPGKFKAAVVRGKDNSPRYFVFDTRSFWDLLCAFDSVFERFAPAEAYASRNPFGWLIDAIESCLPLKPSLVRKLKKSMAEAQKLGSVPFETIKRKLGLV